MAVAFLGLISKMNRRAIESDFQSGFTLVELIAIVLLIAILSAVAIPRMFDATAFNARGFHDETLSFLRYAQKTAVAQRRVVCLTFSANSTMLRIGATPTQTTCNMSLRGPTGDVPGKLTAQAGLAYSVVPTDFNFNGLGQPVDGAGATVATQTLQVSGLSRAITVEATTGLVHE